IIAGKGFPNMNVLIDTNVVLDVLLGREPFVAQSAKAPSFLFKPLLLGANHEQIILGRQRNRLCKCGEV
ncbi:MAG: PIN domain-containing protein, partial [Clostridiales Family XIII bacterium]|nr:PIN domain-containing protein [Clostridiales Family XIII bacterium]